NAPMRVPNRIITTDVGFNMTPMIDVVFQLIIFFLVSSHLAKQERDMPLPLPRAKSAAAARVDKRPRLTVNVLAEGTLLVGNHPLTADELVNLLRDRRAAHGEDLEV